MKTEKRYTNPVLPADFSDPDVIRVGGDFYLTASSFNMVPGLPILHSKDLVHWRRLGYALNHLPAVPAPGPRRKEGELDYDRPRPGCGVYAPCIRHHEGCFWIFWGDPDAGIYQVKAENPEGPWSKPHLLLQEPGIIDTSPLWDVTTGRAWLSFAYARSRAGIKDRIDVVEMAWDGTRLIGDRTPVYDLKAHDRYRSDREQPTIEGTKFHMFGREYYILCPAGSVPFGWQTVMRARDPQGPYEIRTVLETGDTNINGPHQGALVDTAEGTWWFLHFQHTGALGRIGWLQPVTWKDGWPVMGIDDDGDGIGNPVHSGELPVESEEGKTFALSLSDDFSGSELGRQWQWPCNPRPEAYRLQDSTLHLFPCPLPSGKLEQCPTVLTQMLVGYHSEAVAEVELMAERPGIRGGLAAMGIHCSDISVEARRLPDGSIQRTLSVRNDGRVMAETDCATAKVYLKLQTRGTLPLPFTEKEGGRITGQFSYSTDGETFTPLGDPVEVHPGRWIGARLGLFCAGEPEGNACMAVSCFRVSTFAKHPPWVSRCARNPRLR
jgi:hypothetical protein